MKPQLAINFLKDAFTTKVPATLMLSVKHPKASKKLKDRIPVNVCFSLDRSGSMSQVAGTKKAEPVRWIQAPVQPAPVAPKMPPYPNPWPVQPFGVPDPRAPMLAIAGGAQAPLDINAILQQGSYDHASTESQTKLDRVKSACQLAILGLSPTDRFSVVTFDGRADILVESCFATPQNVADAIAKISRVQTGGSTALYDGWKLGVEQVCKFLDPKYINRVLLLTDGEATDGIRDQETLGSHANKMTEHHITTSTFGVGLQYNEDLLEHMAIEGQGRYYYMSDDDEYSAVFENEFKGMSSSYGRNVSITVTADGVSSVISNNELPQQGNTWKAPAASYAKEEMFIFTLNMDALKKASQGTIVYSWFDNESQQQETQTVAWNLKKVSAKAYDALPENEAVGKRRLELEVAHAKKIAMDSLKAGDIFGSRTILNNTRAMVAGSSYACGMDAETTRLDTLLQTSHQDVGAFRKMASYDSYNARQNKS